jgi:hypothetical protein
MRKIYTIINLPVFPNQIYVVCRQIPASIFRLFHSKVALVCRELLKEKVSGKKNVK